MVTVQSQEESPADDSCVDGVSGGLAVRMEEEGVSENRAS